MGQTKKFAELEHKMSPESRARSDAIYRQLLTEIPLGRIASSARSIAKGSCGCIACRSSQYFKTGASCRHVHLYAAQPH